MKRTILTKKEQSRFLETNWKTETLHFKWSRTGKCTLYDKRDNKLGSAGGYGYDKQGTAFGEFLNTYFAKELKKINSVDYYGLTHWNSKTRKSQKYATKNTKTYVDGGCGFQSMRNIFNKIGFDLKFIKETKNDIIYFIEPLHKERKKYLK